MILFQHLSADDWVVCLLAILVAIAQDFKQASDKFENNKKENFNNLYHLQKNMWDFILITSSGFFFLIIIHAHFEASPESYDWLGLKPGGDYQLLLSGVSGLLGSYFVVGLLAVKKLLKKD